LGAQGQDYVRTWFGSPKTYAWALEEAVRALRLPLAERMRSQGLRRAARFARPVWREQFGRLIEELLDSSPRPYRDRVEIRPRSDQRSVSAGATAMSLPVRVVNRGTHV